MVNKRTFRPLKGMEKMTKKTGRDRKGRFTTGNIGGPGRRKVLPKELISKGGRGKSLDKLISDLLSTYEAVGSEAFLKKWATASHRNLTKFVELLYRFATPPEVGQGDLNIQVVSAVPRPGSGDVAASKVIRDLREELKERDKEIKRLNSILDFTDVVETEHEVIPPDELPEHREEIKELSDEELEEEIKKTKEEVNNEQKESEEEGKGESEKGEAKGS